MKRDHIKEILEKKHRSYVKTERFWAVSKKYSSILNSHNYIISNIKSIEIKKELLKYIPMSLVTLLENYFRQLIKDIISSNNQYLVNVNKLKNIKIDLEDVISAQEKSLTIADLVSHLIPTNNLNDILANLSTILNEDYGQLLKVFVSSHEKFKVFNCDEIFKYVSRAFELRNIYVHEYAFKVSIKHKEIQEVLDNCYIFIFLSDIMINRKLKT